MIRLLPFQFKEHSDGRILLVNSSGDYYFVSKDTFEAIISHKINEYNPDYYNLKSRMFFDDGTGNSSIQMISAKYRSRKSYLRDFTSFHMMVITLRCNQKCEYCQVSCAENDAYKYDMSIETAYKIVDMIFESPSDNVKIEFQGGEPTLHFGLIEKTVLYAKTKNNQFNKTISFVICTNLTAITKEQLIFCRDNNIYISTSLDGPNNVHDTNIKNLSLARNILGKQSVDALMTTTSTSLRNLHRVVDEYIELGFAGIFIRSLNPYGFAAENSAKLGYSMDEFVDSYIDALKYIISINKNKYFPEYFATLLFSRILTPFSTGFVDLQSPAGTGISGVIYDFDGSVYPSDEARMLARMGDKYFNLGNVYFDSYKSIFGGGKLKNIISSSCVETTMDCAYCVYQSYCGTDPIRNYLESGMVNRKMGNTNFCIKHKRIFDYLFSFLSNMSEFEENIIWNWITRSNTVNGNA
ncbi:MAG: His-Xaa-Ser system radical SAM maturase HxsB [Spirochaetia bacterium]|jgi:His-Xaa-Ser system radical SAM maturase HxsB|nr:His-Xaa-Ser system radical SAM maturase HxsB [Spirochaetia bacterium]